MGKKIEIELNNLLYQKINQQAEAKSMMLEDYLILLIKGNEALQEEKLKDYQGYVIKELETLLDKVKGKNGSANHSQQKNKVLIYSYKTYRQELPKEIEGIVEFYKKKGWFNEDFFFLILDRKGIVGYMGLNLQTEELPYGGYMFLYSLNLSKSYQNLQNYKYIAGFIHAIAKKEKYHSVDISSVSTNIEDKELQSMGFKNFDSSSLLRGRVLPIDKSRGYEVYKLKTETIQLSDLMERGYLSSGRMLPMGFVYSLWQKKESKVEIHKYQIKVDQKEIEFAVVVEEGDHGQEGIHQYTILVDPNTLFDEGILKSIYTETVKSLVQLKTGNRVQLMIPEDLLEEIKFIEKEGIKKLRWYRMMII